MEKERLEQLVNIKTGKLNANASDENGVYPFFTCSKETLRINKYSYDCECVLVAGNGDLNAKYYNGKFDAYQRTYILTNKDKDKLNLKYLYYFMQNYVETLRNQSIGGVIKYIKLENLTEAKINLVSLERQEEIINTLQKAEEIINERKRQIENLQILVKSQFVEMFGNLSENTMHWKEYDINKIVKGNLNNGYFAKRNEYVENGNVEIIGVASVVNRMFSNIDNLPMTNANKQDIEKYRVRYGDLLFCRSSLVAEGIGKASIVPKNVKSNQLFECHVIRMHLNLNECVPEYIQKLTEDNYFRKQLMKGAKTATMTTIGQNDILKCKVLLPPIELQNKFASFVEQIDKQKFEELKSEKLLKNLIDEGAKNVKF